MQADKSGKSIIGRVSKNIMETLNATTKEKTKVHKVHKWQNTKSVIAWLNRFEN